VRWFYCPAGSEDQLVNRLRGELPASVHIFGADELFVPGSLARSRVGQIALVARGSDFVTFNGHMFDHGSDTDGELYVPYGVWNA